MIRLINEPTEPQDDSHTDRDIADRNIAERQIVDLDTADRQIADRELEQRVRTYLGTFNMPALRRLAIEARSGTVTLRGRVATYYQKQLSYQCPRHVDGIRRLVDEIIVGRPETHEHQGQAL